MRLLLVDDHVLFRQGLKFLLQDLADDLVFTEAGNATQAARILADEAFDLVLLDLTMPGSTGLDALRTVAAVAKGTSIAVLSGDDDPAHIRTAIDEGASGYVVKASSPDVLLAALRSILAGGVYLPPRALGDSEPPVTGAAHDAKQSRGPVLSARQSTILLRAVRGTANKVIAADLGIAEGTVKAHLSNAYRALGVRNRTEAVFAAARLGITTSGVSAE